MRSGRRGYRRGDRQLSSGDRHPEVGCACRALSDIKTFRFTDEGITGDHADAFAQYQTANSGSRAEQPHGPRAIKAEVAAARWFPTPALFDCGAGGGCADGDPIFIVGLPRSGSMLVEQIFSSHSAIRATRELSDLGVIVRHFAVSPQGREALGRVYLRRKRGHRRTDRPMFIDKAPADFRHAAPSRRSCPTRGSSTSGGVRRGGLSICKQLFSRGYAFANLLEDIAAYRRGYVRMMPLRDDLLPGAVHRVEMQDLVTDRRQWCAICLVTSACRSSRHASTSIAPNARSAHPAPGRFASRSG